MMWPEHTIEQVAYHEAGHAVTRSFLGIPYSHVEVIDTGDARVVSGDQAVADWLPTLPEEYTVGDAINVVFDTTHSRDLLDFAVTAAAGPVAQMRFEGRDAPSDLRPFRLFGGPGDASQVQQYALILAGMEDDKTVRGVVGRKEQLIAEILREAASILSAEWDWVERVAARLQPGALSREAVEELRSSVP